MNRRAFLLGLPFLPAVLRAESVPSKTLAAIKAVNVKILTRQQYIIRGTRVVMYDR